MRKVFTFFVIFMSMGLVSSIDFNTNLDFDADLGDSQANSSSDIFIGMGSIEIEGVQVDSTLETTQREDGVYVMLSTGEEVRLEISPAEAEQTATTETNTSCQEGCEIEMQEESEGRVIYEVESERPVRLFGLFTVGMDVETKVDAQTGAVLEVNRPWWASLSTNARSSTEVEY